MVVRGRIDLIVGATSSEHQDESFDISNSILRYLEAPETAGMLYTFRKDNENCPYDVTIVEKLTTRLTVVFFKTFFGRPDLLDHCGSNGGKIKLIRSSKMG